MRFKFTGETPLILSEFSHGMNGILITPRGDKRDEAPFGSTIVVEPGDIVDLDVTAGFAHAWLEPVKETAAQKAAREKAETEQAEAEKVEAEARTARAELAATFAAGARVVDEDEREGTVAAVGDVDGLAVVDVNWDDAETGPDHMDPADLTHAPEAPDPDAGGSGTTTTSENGAGE